MQKNGKVRINGETSPTFTRVEENESTSPGLSPLLTRSQMFEGVARVDSPLQLQEDNSNRVSRLEQLASSAINNPQTENTDKVCSPIPFTNQVLMPGCYCIANTYHMTDKDIILESCIYNYSELQYL